MLFPPCGSLLESPHFGLEISDFGFKLIKLKESAYLEFRNPQSAFRNYFAPILQYSKRACTCTGKAIVF
jgi:hypothetical protein